ncbi:hypothetical protein NFI96_026209, partial [Prochilodus magdalenae]
FATTARKKGCASPLRGLKPHTLSIALWLILPIWLTLLAIPLQWFNLLLLSPEVDLPANSVGSLPAPGSGTDVLNSVDQFNMEHRKKLYLLISCSSASCYPPLSLL